MNINGYIKNNSLKMPEQILNSFTESKESADRVLNDMLRTFMKISTPGQLSGFVGFPFSELETCINYPVYYEMFIEKKNGRGKRFIQEPSLSLKCVQRSLNEALGYYYSLIRPKCVHGFVRNYGNDAFGIVSNAKQHAGQPYLMNLDLKDFFSTIRASKVKELLDSELFKFNDHISTALTLLMTYKGSLPQGAPSSPVLSNFVSIPLDMELMMLAEKSGWNYTRYADDLTFSSHKPFTDDSVLSITALIQKMGFTVNQAKTRLKGKGRKQVVTGLVVNEKVNVDNHYRRKLRAMLHDAEVNGVVRAALNHFSEEKKADADLLTKKFLRKLKGMVSFLGHVRGYDDSTYLRFRLQMEKIRGV